MLTTPIAFFVFNRPDVTGRVFEAIRAARPRQLFIIADGPRANRAGEADRVAETRRIVDRIDWPCERMTKYAPENLGCGRSVSQGLDWVFDNAETSIILEDDCLPHPDFFPFCQRLLDRYAEDDRVAHIGGDGFHGNAIKYPGSYYFSRFPHVWGWATWRRAWRDYDFAISNWPAVRVDATMDMLFNDPVERAFWRQSFDKVHAGEVDTWDAQWSYALLTHGRLAINPATNLVSNVGFGPEATHTRGRSSLSNMATAAPGEWRDPAMVVEHRSADARTFEIVFDGATFRRKQLHCQADSFFQEHQP